VLAAGVVAACVVAGLGALGTPAARSAMAFAKDAGRRVLGLPAWIRRAATRGPDAGFDRLAASQVGYGPSMPKAFTSPRPFDAFRVLREADGTVVYAGRGARELSTDALGRVGRVWIGDFSGVRSRGRYRVVADNGLASHPFDVGDDVFDGPIRAVQRAFYFQRAFTSVDAAHAEGPWTHPSDASRAPAGERSGWHDAGDFSVYNASATTALFWLLEAYSDFAPDRDDTNIPESGNGVPDLLDEARWGLEWMLSVQEPSGGFRNATCQEHYGPYGTNRPEEAPRYRSGEAGTLATARAVGTLAYAAAVFGPHDAAFAERCLAAARRGYRFLEARPEEDSDGPTCPAFRQDGDRRAGRAARMYAAAGMLLATGEARFRADFEDHYDEVENDPSYLRTNVLAALVYLRAKGAEPARKAAIRSRLRARADLARADGDRHPFQWATRYLWGSLGAGFERSGAFSARMCLEDPAGSVRDCEQALANVHYLFGRNYRQFCYVSGLAGVTSGRAHAFHQWLAALRATPFLFPGMVAGGPAEAPSPLDTSYPSARPLPVWGYWDDPAFPRDAGTPLDGRYTDNDSWYTNEIDVEWQGVSLYNLYFAQWWARGCPPIPANPAPRASACSASQEAGIARVRGGAGTGGPR